MTAWPGSVGRLRQAVPGGLRRPGPPRAEVSLFDYPLLISSTCGGVSQSHGAAPGAAPCQAGLHCGTVFEGFVLEISLPD